VRIALFGSGWIMDFHARGVLAHPGGAIAADARVVIERHVQGDSRAKEMWSYVSNELRRAALGGDMAELPSVLEMALSLEGLEWALH